MKVLLGIASVFVLCIGIIAWKGYSWWQKDGKAAIAAMQASASEGRTFAKTADNAACMKSALERFSEDSGLVSTIRATAFMQSCLPDSTPTPGFCDGVPEPRNFSAVREWVTAKCGTVTTADLRTCRVVMGPVPRFCHPRDKAAA